MAFSDPRYLLFLVAAVSFVVLMPAGKARLVAVIIASSIFLVLLQSNWYILPFVAAVAYFSGLALKRLPDGQGRKWLFVASLCAILVPLLTFKYSFAVYLGVASYFPIPSDIFSSEALILPIGLSFYTFLAAGYLIDVYVENVEAEVSPFNFAAMMSFFPMVTAGPIERASHFLPQLAKLGAPSYEQTVLGLRAILLGLLLKVVIADSLAPNVAVVFNNPESFGATDLALGNLYFAFQVYADFAGYSLIAIGSARLLGIELLPNFRQPYFSQSIGEFWRRWHISMSSWFRDYVFMPLQFRTRRSGVAAMAAALIFTFMLVGVWHGAGMKYVLFGLIHGILVAYSTLTLAKRDKYWRKVGMPKPVLKACRILVTFFIVYLTLILFRANDVDAALVFYKGLLAGFGPTTLPLLLPLTVIFFAVAVDFVLENKWAIGRAAKTRWVGYYIATSALICFTVLDIGGRAADGQFIYFSF